MKKKKILMFVLCFAMLVGCKSTKEIYTQVSDNLHFYPTEDIMSFLEIDNAGSDDLYSPESKSDRGTWQLSSSYSTYENNSLFSYRMLMHVNLNTYQITGTYYVSAYHEDDSEQHDEYRLTYDENGYHLLDEVHDETLRNRILNFQFMFQYVELSESVLNTFRIIDKKYNYNIKSYGLHYAFDNQQLLNQLQEHYKIDDNVDDATLILENDGSGSNMRIEFNNKKKSEIREEIAFRQSEEFMDLNTYYNHIDNTSLMQYFSKVYSTQDMDSFFTKEAYEFDRHRGTWKFYYSIYEENDFKNSVRYEIDKETKEQKGSYMEHDTMVDIAYKDQAFYAIEGKDKEVNNFHFLFQNIAIDTALLPEPIHDRNEYSKVASATYTLQSDNEVFQNIKNMYPHLQIADELQLILSVDLDTNLAYGFGGKKLELSYVGTHGKQIQVTETIEYY